MSAFFWLVLLVFLQVHGQELQHCVTEDIDRMFECHLVLTETYGLGHTTAAMDYLIKVLKGITEKNYGEKECINFWRMTLCARTLKPCDQKFPSALIEDLNEAIERAFGICNGLDANTTKEMVECYSFLKGETCKQYLRVPCDTAYFDCIYKYIDRECVHLNQAGRKLLCYLVGWGTKNVCLYHSICTEDNWTKEAIQDEEYEE